MNAHVTKFSVIPPSIPYSNYILGVFPSGFVLKMTKYSKTILPHTTAADFAVVGFQGKGVTVCITPLWDILEH